MEVERNLQDAMNVARNVMVDARLTPGGGATEMAVAWVGHLLLYMGSGLRRHLLQPCTFSFPSSCTLSLSRLNERTLA